MTGWAEEPRPVGDCWCRSPDSGCGGGRQAHCDHSVCAPTGRAASRCRHPARGRHLWPFPIPAGAPGTSSPRETRVGAPPAATEFRPGHAHRSRPAARRRLADTADERSSSSPRPEVQPGRRADRWPATHRRRPREPPAAPGPRAPGRGPERAARSGRATGQSDRPTSPSVQMPDSPASSSRSPSQSPPTIVAGPPGAVRRAGPHGRGPARRSRWARWAGEDGRRLRCRTGESASLRDPLRRRGGPADDPGGSADGPGGSVGVVPRNRRCPQNRRSGPFFPDPGPCRDDSTPIPADRLPRPRIRGAELMRSRPDRRIHRHRDGPRRPPGSGGPGPLQAHPHRAVERGASCARSKDPSRSMRFGARHRAAVRRRSRQSSRAPPGRPGR